MRVEHVRPGSSSLMSASEVQECGGTDFPQKDEQAAIAGGCGLSPRISAKRTPYGAVWHFVAGGYGFGCEFHVRS